MHRTISLLLTTAVLALALVGVASAQVPQNLPKPGDPQFAVPQGKVEHTVTVVDVTGTKAVESHQRVERWLSANRARVVVTDPRTGKLVSDTTWADGVARVFDAKTNTIERIADGADTPPWNAASFEAAVQKAYVEQGITQVTGETTVNGRRALITQSVPGKWRSDDARSVTTAVVDAETYALYERTTSLPNGEFTQHERYQVSELLNGGAATAHMAMAKHRGAKVKKAAKAKKVKQVRHHRGH